MLLLWKMNREFGLCFFGFKRNLCKKIYEIVYKINITLITLARSHYQKAHHQRKTPTCKASSICLRLLRILRCRGGATPFSSSSR
jgi:hypothetical protein